MFPNIDPRKMQSMLKQLGMQQDEIEATRVIIEQADKKIIIENPSVARIKMQGQESWQISGNAREEESNNEGDIKTVMEKTGKSREEAEKALKESNGDLAEAILGLSS
ncbi:MAG: nascent polypeptide-associated complex protein [Nanoarchaeota archaeon]